MNRILTIILFALFLTALHCQAQDNAYRHDAEYPFIIISSENLNQAPQISDETFYTVSTGVIFEVSKTDIRPDDPFFKLYQDEILPYVNQQHLQLRKVFIRGAASPEGSYANNRRLGQARSQALLNALRSQLRNQYIETDSEVSSVTEDYGYLCQLMKDANDADYATVQKIYDNCQGNEPRIKQQLMAVQGGRLDVDVLPGVVLRHDGECISVLEGDDGLPEQGAAYGILAGAGCNRIEAEGAHDIPRRHGSLVLVAGIALGAGIVHLVHYLPCTQLGLPRLTCIVVEIRHVLDRLIAVRVLSEAVDERQVP